MQKISMRISSEELTINEAFQNYISKCKIRNLSLQTIKCYNEHYNIFSRYIGVDSKVIIINRDTVDDFIVYLKDNYRCNEITINSYLRSIRAFLYWLMEGGYLNRFNITMPKVDKKIKETYTDYELKLLLRKPDTKKCKFVEYRMWVFSSYLLATGNRISSAINIKINDIDYDNNMIRINKTKNRRAQVIPLSNTLANILKEYMQFRGGEGEDYLFCTDTAAKACRRTYQDALAAYNRSRGVMKTSAHLYRHTFAKQWILNGGDIFRLQKILGHSDLTVVKEYVNMFGNDLSIDFDRFNPLDTLGLNQQRKQIKM